MVETRGAWKCSAGLCSPPPLPSLNSYNPFEGPNENPEAELPLTAGEYIYVYGNMDEDGFFEGRLVVEIILSISLPLSPCSQDSINPFLLPSLLGPP
jgi:hypothetical protein